VGCGEATNLSSEGGGGARAANAAAARPDDEEIVVIVPTIRDGRHLPVDEHLPRHGWIPNARETKQNPRSSAQFNAAGGNLAQQNRGDKRARNFAGGNNTKLFRSKSAPAILTDDTEGFVTGASGFRRSHRMYVTCGSRSRLRFCLASS
jgi:hypothetical protein